MSRLSSAYLFPSLQTAATAEPWKSAYAKAASNDLASLSRTPKPRATVECGPYSDPNFGYFDESGDAKAAYTQALLWKLDGKEARAVKAATLLDAWSAVLTAHTHHNAPL